MFLERSSGLLARRRLVVAGLVCEISGLRFFLFGDETHFLRLLQEELLQPNGALELLGLRFVVGEAVDKNLSNVIENFLVARVLHLIDVRANRAQVHRPVNNFVIVRRIGFRDRPVERPSVVVLHHRVQQVFENCRIEDGLEFVVDVAATFGTRLRNSGSSVWHSTFARSGRSWSRFRFDGSSGRPKSSGRTFPGWSFTSAAVAGLRFLFLLNKSFH